MLQILEKKQNRGFTLVEIMVATGILLVGTMGLMTFVSAVKQMKTKTDTAELLIAKRAALMNVINSPKAWSQVVADGSNPSLACLRYNDSTSSNPGAQHAACDVSSAKGYLNISDGTLDADGTRLYLASTSATKGFDLQGATCNNFDDTSGSGTCPYKYKVYWQAACSNGASSCNNPLVRISLQLDYKPTAALKKSIGDISAAKYNANFIRGNMLDNSMVNFCNAAGGTYNAVGDTCTLSMFGKSCGPGMAIQGINPVDNTMVCARFAADLVGKTWCGPNEILRGLDISGNPVCTDNGCCYPIGPPTYSKRTGQWNQDTTCGMNKPTYGGFDPSWVPGNADRSWSGWQNNGGDGGCDGMPGGDPACGS